MNADDIGSAISGERGRGDGRVLAIVGLVADRPVHRLVRVTDQHGTVERGELPGPVQQIERLGARLAEAESGVDDHAVPVDPGRVGKREPLAKLGDHVRDDIVVLGLGRRVDRRVEAVHHYHRAVGIGDHLAHRGIRESGNVVDDVRARVESGRRDGCLPGVDRDENVVSGDRRHRLDRLDRRDDAVDLLVDRNRLRAGPSRFTADIDDVDPGVDHPPDSRDRVLQCLVAPAVVEGVGSDVEHAHHRGAVGPGVVGGGG